MSSTSVVDAHRVCLREVEELVGVWCEQLDPACLTGDEASVLVERLAVVGRRVAAKQAALAARVAECRACPGRSSSPEEYLAKANGTSRSAAKRMLDTARRLRDCPQTAAAVDAGVLSIDEADLITAAAVLDPAAEATLVAKATSGHDLAEVRDAADRVKRAARAGEDPGVRRARLRAARRWREWNDDGLVGVDARFVADEWAAVRPVLDAFADAQFHANRKDGVRDSFDGYRADGLLAALAAAGNAVGVELPALRPAETSAAAADSPAATTTPARGPAATSLTESRAGGPEPDRVVQPDADETMATLRTLAARVPKKVNWNVTVMVDGIALKRGYPSGDEVCEIPGIGMVDVPWVRSLLDDAVVDVLVHDLHDITAYGTHTRHKPRAVKVAVAARDRRCVVPGCRRMRRCQLDHRHDHAHGGPTKTHNVELLCERHHAHKTHRGARLERTPTEWHWYPPPPAPGEPEPPPGSIPWRAPVGEHLPAWDLDHLPDQIARIGSGDDPARGSTDDTLPFG